MTRMVPVVLWLCAACARPAAPPVASVAAVPASAPALPPVGPVLDVAVRAQWAAAHATPAPDADDATYLRRVTLDLVGRIPTRAEVAAYRGDKAAVVAALLASPDYAEHWADVYEDLLVGRAARLRPEGRGAVRAFLVDAFARGLPYDELARKVLTATGPLAEHGEGGFLVTRGGMGGSPEAVAGATARIFLGLSLQCAQCHDHPYDPRYKQEDFYGLAAFFARTRARPADAGDGKKTVELFDVRVGQIQMKKHGTDEEIAIRPRFLGREPAHTADDLRRPVLAREIIASDLFAKAVVNRTWAHLFGRGLVEPRDDLGGEHDPEHPPTLTLLASDFVAHGYDLRSLLATIVLSEAYGRASTGGSDGAEAAFARAAVRPMPPEALFRSLYVATGLRDSSARRLSPEEIDRKLEAGLRQFVVVFGDDEMAEVDRGSGTVQQSLLLMNGEVVNQGVKARPGSALRAILDETRDPGRRLEALFATAFARAPTAAERARLTPKLGPAERWEDLFAAMLTSTEFTTIH
jgi:hypothetical protein